MQHNYTGRVIVILAVLLGSLYLIFPSGNLAKPNLKPGIDMVGGTSLLYEIKPPPGNVPPDLSEQVMTALKRRVDPDGVRNLIWRPQGTTRLEIQMPMSGQSEQSKDIRDRFSLAQEKLNATNVRPGEVMTALSLPDRDKQLERLAMGSPVRQALFAKLAATYDRVEQLKKSQSDFQAQAQAESELAALKNQIEATNLLVGQLQSVLEAPQEVRQAKLDEIKKQAANFPARAEAIEQFVSSFDAFAAVKNRLDDAAELKRLLTGAGVLEFHILANDLSADRYQAMVQRLQSKGPRVESGDEVRWFLVDQTRTRELPTQQIEQYNGKHYTLAYITPDKSLDATKERPWKLASVYGTIEGGSRKVNFAFDAQGADYFGQLTGANVSKPLAIVLDERIISAPNINQRINGSGEITGNFSKPEQEYLVNTLRAGALPAQLSAEPISERTVGPTIGKDNLRLGLYACYFGLVVVAVFLIGYYYLAGVVAMIAVLLNMAIILGSMAAFDATFTLAGVAGIVLTIGMAVDANVLIFERLREEQLRGLSLRMALRNAYDRAFSAILDSNVTTAVTAAILYVFGSEEVKGFGLTLLLGLVASLFTALFVTKTIFGILIDHFGLDKLSSLPLTFPKWDQLLKPKIDWMSKAWMFYTFSSVFIVVGCALFAWKFARGQVLDIEFASGTSVQFELKQPMKQQELREIIEEAGRRNPTQLPAPAVVTVGSDEKTYEVVTPNPNVAQVREVVLTTLADKLDIDVPSEFTGASENYDQAEAAGRIVPLAEDKPFSYRGWTPAETRSFTGGVAIVLENLQPPISPNQIKRRIVQQQLQPQPGQAAAPYRDFAVVSEGDANQPTSAAVVLVADPNLSYAQDAARWENDLAKPMWNLVNSAVNKPAQLQKVTNFDAQVAGETQSQAFVALTLSILVIVAYIWLRFGNLKYGTATVIALLHDTLFTVAAVGFAHVLANTAVGDALLIEPFRLNLTLLAAILTVMGYSMNDTVVVFDRIRENRGKFGLVNRDIINDSINQTLSRTLLTGGTTIITIFVMYIFGGPAIHGFTFALLVGILVGTYSSIAIASPMLLLGTRSQTAASSRARIATA